MRVEGDKAVVEAVRASVEGALGKGLVALSAVFGSLIRR